MGTTEKLANMNNLLVLNPSLGIPRLLSPQPASKASGAPYPRRSACGVAPPSPLQHLGRNLRRGPPVVLDEQVVERQAVQDPFELDGPSEAPALPGSVRFTQQDT